MKNYKQCILFSLLISRHLQSVEIPLTLPSYSTIFNTIKSKLLTSKTNKEVNEIFCIKISGFMNEQNAEKIIHDIITAKKNKTIKGVIIIVNSGGGNFGELIQRELTELQKTKPVIAFVTHRCCSAAYQAICGVNLIVTLEESTVGSIGVLSELVKHKITQLKGKNYKGEAHIEIISGGDYKALGHPDKPINKEQKEHFTNFITSFYKDFIKNVAEKRNLNINESSKWANGKVFTGPQALENSLTDKIGGYSDSLNEMKQLLNLDDEKELTIIKGETFYYYPNPQRTQKSNCSSITMQEQPIFIK